MFYALVYYSEFILAPILATYLIYISSLHTSDLVALFAGGVVTWTLVEYAVHRWVLHDFAPKGHAEHHARPNDAISINPLTLVIWSGFTVTYLIAGGGFLAGALSGYTWVLFVHELAHFRPDFLPSALLVHHAQHHKWATRNFGVSTTLWDHVFGTKL